MPYRLLMIGFVIFNVAVLTAKEHPFLFLSETDIDRIQKNINEDVFFKKLAQEKIARAKSIKTDTLPEFDNLWQRAQNGKEYLNGIDRQITVRNQRTVPLRYGNSAKDLALGYVLTKDDTFALNAKSVLLKLTELDFVNVDVNGGLDYTVALLPAIEAYDLVYGFFDSQENEKMKKMFMSLVKTVGQCADYWQENMPAGVPLSNHEGWHHVCFAMVGFFYNDQALIDRAIKGAKGFETMLTGFQDDGIWLEASLPYHFVQLDSMLKIAEMSYNCGYELNLYEYTIDGRSLSQIYGAVVDLLFPNALLPSLGDGYGKLYYPAGNGVYELLYTRTGDQRFAFLLSRNETRSSDALLWGATKLPDNIITPKVYSKLWPQHGYAALRTQEGADYWKGEGNTLFASFSHNTCHHHADGLSIMLFAKNHLWLRDAECKPARAEAFGSDVNQQLNWTTVSHNTVIVDSSSQNKNPKPLDLVEFTILPKVKRLCMGDLNGHLYEGVRQLRTCVVTDDYVLDVFEVASDDKHKYSWATHIDAEPVGIFDGLWRQSKWEDAAEWSYLKDKEISKPGQEFWETFTDGEKYFRVDLVCSKPASYIKTLYPVEGGDNVKYIPMRLLEAQTENIVYAAVYRTGDSDIKTPVMIELKNGVGDNRIVAVNFKGKQFSHRVSSLKRD